MGGPIPTLGYPSRTDAVMALSDQGVRDGEIAARIGISGSSVAALRCSARRRGQERRPADTMRTVHVPVGLLQRLAPAARKRGLNRETLAALIVEFVVEHDLVDAVMDDQPDDDRRTSR